MLSYALIKPWLSYILKMAAHNKWGPTFHYHYYHYYYYYCYCYCYCYYYYYYYYFYCVYYY